jgi:uncharacterized protein
MFNQPLKKEFLIMSESKLHPKGNPVTWFEIYVDDLARAKVFYESLFECTLNSLPTDGSFEALSFEGKMPATGAMGALMHHPMRRANALGTVVYFHVQDCAEQLEKVLGLGGQILRDKWSIGEDGFIALVSDSEGNTIGLNSFK